MGTNLALSRADVVPVLRGVSRSGIAHTAACATW